MGIFDELFDSNKPNPLVEKLISNDESTFLNGLTEAVEIADSGNYSGVETMQKAIKIRSGKTNINFFKPGIRTSFGEIDFGKEAKAKILELARRKALLEDVYLSGDLISKFNYFGGHGELSLLLEEVYRIGGDSQGHAFQLLFNEMRCSAKLQKKV